MHLTYALRLREAAITPTRVRVRVSGYPRAGYSEARVCLYSSGSRSH